MLQTPGKQLETVNIAHNSHYITLKLIIFWRVFFFAVQKKRFLNHWYIFDYKYSALSKCLEILITHFKQIVSSVQEDKLIWKIYVRKSECGILFFPLEEIVYAVNIVNKDKY